MVHGGWQGGAGPGVEVEVAVDSISNRVAFRPDLVRVWILCGPEKSGLVKMVLFEVFGVSGGFRVEFVGNWSYFSKNGGANWNDLWFGVGCGGGISFWNLFLGIMGGAFTQLTGGRGALIIPIGCPNGMVWFGGINWLNGFLLSCPSNPLYII